MVASSYIHHLYSKQSKKIALLIDPDKTTKEQCIKLLKKAIVSQIDFIFVGGSLLDVIQLREIVRTIKKHSTIPVILFPGSNMQIDANADGLLLLSLISGRNPDMLIGQHVLSSVTLAQSGLTLIPTGYILVDGGKPSSVSYISNTTPIPRDKEDIVLATAMAGQQLGLKAMYLEAGSGAKKSIPVSMIKKVKQHIETILIVGGGIRTAEKAVSVCKAGADIVVIGTAVEKNYAILNDIASAVHKLNIKL